MSREKTAPELRKRSRELVLNVFAMCELAGVNQSELARRLSISRAAVSRWATGGSPSLENLIAIADALEMPLHTLLAPSSAAEKAARLRELDEQYARARAELMKSGQP